MTDETTVRLTEDGPIRICGNGVHWERGETREVSPEHADALLEAHDYVEIVDGPEASDDATDDLESLTKEELYDRATEADISGRSEMDKGELIDALED